MVAGRTTRGGRGAVALVLAAFLACLLLPAAAAGARVTVPPGATEGDQYFEEAPNGGGSGSVEKGGGAPGGSAGGPPAAATPSLERLGADGKAAAALANANRPPQAKLGTNLPANAAPDQPSSDTQGEGGMGFWFPLLIILTALAAVAYGLGRRLMPT